MADALERLDQRDVLELIDYRPEMMQLSGDSIRCFCPIHKDSDSRSLTVSLVEKTFVCQDPVCPGSKGGNLIELYALAMGKMFDDAMVALADEFGFALLETASQDSLETSLREAQELLAKAESEPKKRDKHMAEAERRLRTVISVQGENVEALMGLYGILKEKGNFLELGQLVGQLLDIAESAGSVEEAMKFAREYLEMNPVDIAIRGRVADQLLKRDLKEEAVGELMTLADTAEQAGQLEAALSAYQRIARMRTDVIDVHPMIVNLLVALKRPQDAARQIIGRANWLREHGHHLDAAHTLLNVLDVEPDNVAARFEALKLFIQAELTDDTFELCVQLADGIGERNETARHLKALRLLHQARPDDPRILERLSVAERLNGYSATATELELKLAAHYLRTQNYDGALLLLEQIQHDHQRDTRVLLLIAQVHAAMGDREIALETLDFVATILTEEGKQAELIPVAELAVQLAPDDHTQKMTLAELLIGAGQSARAKEIVTQLCALLEKETKDAALAEALGLAAKLEPAEPRHMLRMAEAYGRLANLARAIDARLTAARLLLAQGRGEQAEAQVRLVLEEAPNTLEARKLLIEVLTKLGRAADASAAVLALVDTLSEKQQHAEAKELLAGVLKVDPTNLEALSRLGDVCAELGDEAGFVTSQMRLVELQTENRMYDLAIETAEQVVELQKDHEGALASLAKLHELKGDKARTIEFLQRRAESLRKAGDKARERAAVADLLARDPRSKIALERAAFLDFELGNLTEGLARLDEYVALVPTSEASKALREMLMRSPEELGLHSRLIALMRRSGSRDDLVSALQSLILVHERAERWRDAIDIYREVLQLTPDSVISRMAMVEAFKRVGDRGSAITELLRLAELHERQANDDDALGVYEQAERLDPADERAFRGQAEILKRRGRNDLAAGRLRALADALLAQGRRSDAIRIIQSAVQTDPGNREVHRALIAMLIEDDRIDQAVTELLSMAEAASAERDEEGRLSLLREATALKPADTDLRRSLIRALQECERPGEAANEAVSLAEALLAGQKPQEALRTLDEAITRQPDNLRARKIRAEIYLGQGDEKLALAEFRQMAPFLDRASVGTGGAALPSADLQVMPEYIFDSFVVGPRNNFAFATAKAVAKAPGTAYNPVFLYADVGLGKTHLLHAIANSMRAANPAIRITYTNVEDFTAELIQAIESNNVAQWRQRHKSVDVLLIDDVQFLAGKERSQEELFHIFNTLFQSKRQIVVTSDRPPKDLVHLEKRLKSRFGAGVVVDIQSPDIETRMAIIRKEAQLRHASIQLPEEVVRTLAERLDSNVRELKGALNQVILAHELGGAPINVALVQQTVDKLYAGQA